MREICYCNTKLCAWRPNTSLQEEGCIVDIIYARSPPRTRRGSHPRPSGSPMLRAGGRRCPPMTMPTPSGSPTLRARGKTKMKISLGVRRGCSLLLFVFKLPLFLNETRSFATLFEKGVGIFSSCNLFGLEVSFSESTPISLPLTRPVSGGYTGTVCTPCQGLGILVLARHSRASRQAHAASEAPISRPC